ncbi:hypothetical protein [Rhizobium laguerreae]|uniref:hypothetical protein n=1 Tax=Rhizobium laguerreae TaxID=1076926 RepID=UPI001C91B706|nr:hypothetical protein [Rhizobium laguerreae]MBY3434867.1 hypothetical protein [Rhizobium laguerreae]MBY3449009.1 hypothetical protein [Rhizobium laguerreae]MBY3456783.1 hypothetical protein [Rhizobium laguerreae]
MLWWLLVVLGGAQDGRLGDYLISDLAVRKHENAELLAWMQKRETTGLGSGRFLAGVDDGPRAWKGDAVFDEGDDCGSGCCDELKLAGQPDVSANVVASPRAFALYVISLTLNGELSSDE